jgi:hypothetical protein
MKLADLHEETIWRGFIDGKPFEAFEINEAISVRPSRGGIVKQTLRKGAAALKANPGLAALGAGLAVASYTAYSKNKRNTMRLFAKGQKERKMYKQIVDDLMKTGGYKKVREKHVSGGYLWELKRK